MDIYVFFFFLPERRSRCGRENYPAVGLFVESRSATGTAPAFGSPPLSADTFPSPRDDDTTSPTSAPTKAARPPAPLRLPPPPPHHTTHNARLRAHVPSRPRRPHPRGTHRRQLEPRGPQQQDPLRRHCRRKPGTSVRLAHPARRQPGWRDCQRRRRGAAEEGRRQCLSFGEMG